MILYIISHGCLQGDIRSEVNNVNITRGRSANFLICEIISVLVKKDVRIEGVDKFRYKYILWVNENPCKRLIVSVFFR